MQLPKPLLSNQVTGVDFLINPEPKLLNMPHKYLAHAPGLGKTVTIIVAARKINAQSGLIICPSKVKDSEASGWAYRMVEWGLCNREDIGVVTSQLITEEWKRPFIIMSWNMAIKPIPLAYFRERRFDFIEFDESRALASLDSQTSQKILSHKFGRPLIFSGRHKWFTDGTPMSNCPIELFPVSRVCAEPLLGIYKDYNMFGNEFCLRENEETGEADYRGAQNLDKLGKMLSPFMHVVALRDACDMPPLTYRDIFIDVGAMEVDETNANTPTIRKAIGIQKIPYALKIIREILAKDQEKLLVFTYTREVNIQLANALGGIQIIGGMTDDQRERAKARFINGTGESDRILVAQLGAGGDAIDGLQYVCRRAFKVEMGWSTASNNQPVGRIERIGQPREMEVFRLIALNTKDEAVLGTHNRKSRWVKTLFNATNEERNNEPLAREKDERTMIEEKLDRLIELGERQVELLEALTSAEPAGEENPKDAKSAGGAAAGNAKLGTGKDATATSNADKGKGDGVTLEDLRAGMKELEDATDSKIASGLIKEVFSTVCKTKKGETAPKSDKLTAAQRSAALNLLQIEIGKVTANAGEGGVEDM